MPDDDKEDDDDDDDEMYYLGSNTPLLMDTNSLFGDRVECRNDYINTESTFCLLLNFFHNERTFITSPLCICFMKYYSDQFWGEILHVCWP